MSKIETFYEDISLAKKELVKKMKKQAAIEYLTDCEKQLKEFEKLAEETRQMENIDIEGLILLERCGKISSLIENLLGEAKNKLA